MVTPTHAARQPTPVQLRAFTGEEATVAEDGRTYEAVSAKGRAPKRGGDKPRVRTEGNSCNPGKRRVPKFEPQGIGILDAPPAWMDETQRAQWLYAVQNAPPGLLTGTDREVLAVWVVACVEHARAAAGVRSSKTKDGNPPPIWHRQSAGVHHDPQSRRTRLRTLGAGLARHDRGKRARRPALDRRGKFRSMNFVSVVGGS